MKNKKHMLCLYLPCECDALRGHLEAMAERGWKLVKIGQILTFESCEPHRIRYCVEVMDKASAYASNQTLKLKQYREFCREAGWEYIGSNGLMHVFCTEDMDAVPVETDPWERYERICRAALAGNRYTAFLVFALALMQLFTCVQERSLLNRSGFLAIFLLAAGAWPVSKSLLWKRRAKASLEQSGTLPASDWRTVNTVNRIALAAVIAVSAAFIGWMIAGSSFSSPFAGAFIAVYLVMYVLLLIFFSFLIRWLREKQTFSTGVNIAIYWGCGLVLTVLITAAGCWLIFRTIL